MTPLAQKILHWYSQHSRKLPWRDHPDAYAIWVSEVMLQQTRVDAVIPYFENWMKRFPTIKELAQASEQEVLSSWEGLGYYSRARNLHKASKLVMELFDGRIPKDPETLRSLPGVGRYTAAAIASMAYGADLATLDANLKRVLARVYNLEEAADSSQGEKRLWNFAQENLPTGHAGAYNQAMMDLGASICLPRNPRCLLCPLMDLCQARILGVQDSRPILKPKKEIPHYIVTAAIIQRDGEVLIAKRPANGLLGGLWEFPGGKCEPGESLQEALGREIREELNAGIVVGEPYGVYKHAYTHFRITLHAYLCQLVGQEPIPVEAEEIAWVGIDQLASYPMGKVDRLIAMRLSGQND